MTDAWNRLIDRSQAGPDVTIDHIIKRSPDGGSGTFLAADTEGNQWWVKPQNNPQGGKVIVSELVVSRAGELIGAPVCRVAVAEIPDGLAGWEFRSGRRIEAGLAPASMNVPDVTLSRSLEARDRDDNRWRHAGILALYDWCWGEDDQWLYAESNDREIHSHDHGHFFPSGPRWTIDTLNGVIGDAHQPRYALDGLQPAHLGQLAKDLESIERETLAQIMNAVPAEWPAIDEELVGLGNFLEIRAPHVAARLRTLLGGTTS